tara:strand:- start:1469 stop:1873 length:405 start_codon:yes stop_codon:yes gene_type:complete
MMVAALIVIGQYLYHSTIADAAMGAFRDHSFKLCLQERETIDARVDRLQIVPSDTVGIPARRVWFFCHCKEVADIVDVKAELPCMTNKDDSIDILGFVLPSVASRPSRRDDQPDLFVKSDGRNFHTALPGSVAN